MSYHSDSFIEEDSESERNILLFGEEYMYSFNGEKMTKLDEFFKNDEEEGHDLFPNDMILSHRYQIKSMIGRGTFCIVWLAYDLLRRENVAIKVLKKKEAENFEDEYIINAYLSRKANPGEHVMLFYDLFYIGRNCCLVFELGAQNILTFLNYFDSPFVHIPIPLIKKIVIDTLKGLNFLHKNGIIHTDLKPENVLANRPLFPYDSFIMDNTKPIFHPLDDDPSTIEFKLADLGNSCFFDNHLNDLIQTRQYRSPEVLLGIDYEYSADIWSLACMTFELITGTHLFNPEYQEQDENEENRNFFDLIHLALIQSVIGNISEDWAINGDHFELLFHESRNYFYNQIKESYSVFDLLIKNNIQISDAKEISDFLEPMLSIIPNQRPTAEELLESPWLQQI